jgi:hypothetical protein
VERLAERPSLLAPSVQRGEQPREDPDAAYLESIDDDYRIYAFPQNGDASEVRRIRKVLIDGHWSLEESPDVDAQAAA